MADVDIHYTQAYRSYSGGARLGRDVHLIVHYDENSPVTGANGTGYQVTSVSGTYSVLDANGNVIRTDQIIGFPAAGGNVQADNILYNGDPFYVPRVDDAGIGFATSNSADYNNPGDAGIAFSAHISSANYTYFEYPDTYDPATVTFTLLCFAGGTKIRTDGGDRVIESLRVGDLVVTASGAYRPIRWIGRRVVRFHDGSAHEGHYPVRIVAGAMGHAQPAEDLLVSPGHRLVFRCGDHDVLVPASSLVNGATIRSEAVPEVVYWHVELETHDILLANGVGAESYQETGARRFFTGDMHSAPCRPLVSTCLPVIDDPLTLRPVLAALRERAKELGWRLEKRNPEPMIVYDGATHAPVAHDGSVFRFELASPGSDILLLSPVSVPCGVDESLDARQLGLRVRGITLIHDDGGRHDLDQAFLDDCCGFHTVEEQHAGSTRWTNGRACLPVGQRGDLAGAVSLELTLAPHELLSWVAPRQTSRQLHA